MDDFRVVLSGTEAIYVSKVGISCYVKPYSQDLGFINRAFHGFGFKMQVWPHDVEIRKNMVNNLYNLLYMSYSILIYDYIYLYPKPPITQHPNRSPPNGTTS